MYAIALPILQVVFRTLAVYLALLFGLRITGKREIGQMTLFDLTVLLLIANAVQNAMVGPDTSLLGGIVAAFTLLGVNWLIARLRIRWPWLRRLVNGTPTVLILHGQPISSNLNREGIDEETLAAAIREHGVGEMSDVESAVLEVDGSISIVPAGQETRRIKKPTHLLKKN